MKKQIIKSMMLFAILASSASFVSAQIGPVVSISQTQSSLPATVNSFLNSYFPGATPTDIELKTLANVYEIELNNQIELKFDSQTGQWLDIDAPENSTIPQILLADLLPGEIYNVLKRKNLVYKVNEMQYSPKYGYKIETNRGRDYYFDLNGNKIREPKGW